MTSASGLQYLTPAKFANQSPKFVYKLPKTLTLDIPSSILINGKGQSIPNFEQAAINSLIFMSFLFWLEVTACKASLA